MAATALIWLWCFMAANFDIPLSYPSADPTLSRALERFANSVKSYIDQAPRSFAPLMLPQGATGAVLAFGTALRTATNSGDTLTVTLPRVDTRDGGKTCGIYRTTATGSITVTAPNCLVDGAASLTLPTTLALYEFYFDGSNYYSRCCAEAGGASVASGAFAPADAMYWVGTGHAALSSEVVPTGSSTVTLDYTAVPGHVVISAPGAVPIGSGAFAPPDAQYLVAAPHAALSSEREPAGSGVVNWDFSVANQFTAHVASQAFSPRDARYFAAANHAALPNEMVPTNTTTVAWTTTNPGVFGAEVPTFTSALPGVVPASGGGTTNFLRADGTWTSPGAGGVASGAFAPADANYLTVHTGHSALSNERIFSIGSGANATGTPARFLAASDGGVGSFYQLCVFPSKRYVDLVDEFNGGMLGTSNTTIAGDLGWRVGIAAAGSSVSPQTANPTGHPGTYVLAAGGVTGSSLASIALGATGGSYDSRRINEFEYIARVPTVTTRYILEAKMGDGVGTFGGANSIGFEYVPTSTRLMFNVRTASSNSYATGPAASAGAWVHLRAARIPSGGGWEFYVNDTLSQTIASDPAIRVSPSFYLKATNGTAKSTEIDRFRLSTNDLGIRYSNQ
jgi:hypothetical protein